MSKGLQLKKRVKEFGDVVHLDLWSEIPHVEEQQSREQVRGVTTV